MVTIGWMIAMVAGVAGKVHQMNVQSSFLNGYLEQVVYKERLQGFKTTARNTLITSLKIHCMD
jgi:hypothetical protein